MIENHNHLAQTLFLCDFRKQTTFSIWSDHTLRRAEPGESSPSPLPLQRHSRENIPGRAPMSSVRAGNKNFIHQSWFPPLGGSLQELCCLCLTNHFPALKATDTWSGHWISALLGDFARATPGSPDSEILIERNINVLIALLLMWSCFLNPSTPINMFLSWTWAKVSRISPTVAMRIKHTLPENLLPIDLPCKQISRGEKKNAG